MLHPAYVGTHKGLMGFETGCSKRPGVLPLDLDWLIIGGGIHGVHIAARLIGEGGKPPERLRIVDPGERLLDRWRRCTATTGMSHLRSPSVHHLDLDPRSLQRFAGRGSRRRPGAFTPPFDRPALALFNEHCERVAKAHGLDELHIRERVVDCEVDCDRIVARLSNGETIRARDVVLAVGASEQPEWPEWAPKGTDRIAHVFAPDFTDPPVDGETVAVIGGGISAAQVALRLVKEGHPVHLVSRHAVRKHRFDSDPGWLGLKYTTQFSQEPDLDRRRELIGSARNRGSVPPEVGRALQRAITRGRLVRHEAAVAGIEVRTDDVRIELRTGNEVTVDRVLLATGFSPSRPGGAMIDRLVASAALPCARCGYPIVDTALRWHPHIYVSGALAELELGPVSRNIAGARRAGERIVQAVRASRTAREATTD